MYKLLQVPTAPYTDGLLKSDKFFFVTELCLLNTYEGS